jgi:hypothetical protein
MENEKKRKKEKKIQLISVYSKPLPSQDTCMYVCMYICTYVRAKAGNEIAWTAHEKNENN